VKARKVKQVDPAAPLADGARRIVRVRLDELCSFMPAAAEDAVAQHDMRIAAKRLRYALEVTSACFGAYAATATKHARALQDVLGEIHDWDVLLEEVEGLPALEAPIGARRAELHADFLALWEKLRRKGFRARLDYALSEPPS
jgi:CHAD domain-containing protein